MDVAASSLITVARIVKTHGIRGEVVLQSWTDIEGRLETRDRFLLVHQGNVLRELEVESRRVIRGRPVIKFRGIDALSEAEKLRQKELAIPEEETAELGENEFYVHELVGMMVRLMDGTGIGKVKNLLSTGGVDVLEVGEKGEFLIPFTSAICLEVNRERREIRIHPPEGLLQLNAR